MRPDFEIRQLESGEAWVVDYCRPNSARRQLVGVYKSPQAAAAWIVNHADQFLLAEKIHRAMVLKRNNVKVASLGRRAIVFAHGFGCDQKMWRFVAPEFERDFKVVLFDHVGSGESDISAYSGSKYASLSGYAADLVEIGSALNLSDAVLVGHSVSAMIGVLASLAAPDMFSHLVLIGPSARYIDDIGYVGGFTEERIDELLRFLDEHYSDWAAAMGPAIMGNPDRPALANELTDSFCRMDKDVAKDFARATFLSDNRSDLPRVSTPSLIIQCQEDIIAPREVGAFVQQSIPGSELVMLHATGHCPHLSAPDEVIQAIRAFV